MVDFALEEWEWSPGIERKYVVAPFESDCLRNKGIARVIMCAVAASGGKAAYVFYQPCSEGDSFGNSFGDAFGDSFSSASHYVLCYGQHPLRARAVGFDWQAKTLEHHFLRLAPDQYRGGRLFHLAGASCLISDEVGNWIEPNGGTFFRSQSALFRMPAETREMSPPALRQWLDEQFADTDSEVRFSYQWNFKNKDHRAIAIDTTFPVLGEQRQLMQHIARHETPPGESIRWVFHNPYKLDVAVTGPKRFIARPPSIVFQSGPFPASPELEEVYERYMLWGQLLQRHFIWPQVDSQTPNPTLPLCLLQEYETYEMANYQDGSAISQHERLEANVVLREWAKKNATLEEMARLFPTS